MPEHEDVHMKGAKMACRCTHIVLQDCAKCSHSGPAIPVHTERVVLRRHGITVFKGGRSVEDYEPHQSSHLLASFVGVVALVILLWVWISTLYWT